MSTLELVRADVRHASTGLTFDEASHTYRLGSVVIPSVTQVLRPLMDFSYVDPATLQAAAQFGRAVHKACELDDLGTLDESELDPALMPYLQAWRKFSTDLEVKWFAIERIVFHSTLRYAGTLDRYGLVRGKEKVVDIKSGTALYPSVGPQLAAYQRAYPDSSVLTGRMAVQLHGDGTYTTKEYTDHGDWPVFASLLTLKQWCAKHHVTPDFHQEQST